MRNMQTRHSQCTFASPDLIGKAVQIVRLLQSDVLSNAPPIGRCIAPTAARAELASRVADGIAALRLEHLPRHYSSWREKADGSSPTRTQGDQNLISDHIMTGFRTDSAKHLKGLVAENLLYFLCIVGTVDTSPTYARRPKLDPTDHGADGFVVFETGIAQHSFRLWESKATDTADLAGSAAEACRQLAENGGRYLASLVQDRPQIGHTGAADLFMSAPELWANRSEQAGAGAVVVGPMSHATTATAAAFDSWSKHLPWMTGPVQFRAVLSGIDSVGCFATAVKEELWKGL